MEGIMMDAKYLDIVLADLPKGRGHVQSGIRPVLVLSNSTANKNSPIITIVPLTSQLKRLDLNTHVMIQGDGLRKPSIALIEQLMVIDKTCVIKKLGVLRNIQDCTKIKEAIVSHMMLAA